MNATHLQTTALRQQMVQEQLISRKIQNPNVLRAMTSVPRHEFIPESLKNLAYNDCPLSIGHGQTISQPYIVAFMTEQLNLKQTDRVLEIGTGSGYQTAVLSRIVSEVFTVEIIESLAQKASALLARLGYTNIHSTMADGFLGYPNQAPFDAILVTCAPSSIPQPLLDQLKPNGKMICPVGSQGSPQELRLIEKHGNQIHQIILMPVRFVPMISPD